MRRAVIMGVAGSGKSAVGQALMARLGLRYIDGDDLHPPANIAKMSAGEPLSDADRSPWLADVGRTLAASPESTAIGCSALKRAYRDIIRSTAAGPVFFLHLAAAKAVIAERMAARAGHFMPLSLLDSQFEALEPLHPTELGAVVDINQPLTAVVEATARLLQEETG